MWPSSWFLPTAWLPNILSFIRLIEGNHQHWSWVNIKGTHKSPQIWMFNAYIMIIQTMGTKNVGSQHSATHPNISCFLHIEFHISAAEMCKGLVWNYKNKFSKTHLMLVKTKKNYLILYDLEWLRYFWTSKIHMYIKMGSSGESLQPSQLC